MKVDDHSVHCAGCHAGRATCDGIRWYRIPALMRRVRLLEGKLSKLYGRFNNLFRENLLLKGALGEHNDKKKT